MQSPLLLLLLLIISINVSSGCSTVFLPEAPVCPAPLLLLPAPTAPEVRVQKVPEAPEAPEVFPNVSIVQKALQMAPEAPEDVDDDIIHQRSLKIAAFVAQLIVFLMAYALVTADLEDDVPVPVLHRAPEIQTMPLPARQNIRVIHVRTIESTC